MKNPTVLISGASVAGHALALWPARSGFAVTVVEKAPTLREGGQAVDFKGTTHRTVLERPLAVMPGELTGGDIETRRGDLTELLYERTAQDCEYVFGDSVDSLTETADGVDVTFERGAPRRFDLVFGADGIHSTGAGCWSTTGWRLG